MTSSGRSTGFRAKAKSLLYRRDDSPVTTPSDFSAVLVIPERHSDAAATPTSNAENRPSAPSIKDRSLQGRLWDEAYGKLGESEPKVVAAYETILSTELLNKPGPSTGNITTQDDDIRWTEEEERRRHLKLLVDNGLEKTQRVATIKGRIDDGMQALEAVKGVMDKAIKAAPDAALVWVGVCFGLEILKNPVTEANSNRKGVVYVTTRMEWYWNLVCLLLDENSLAAHAEGLRLELEKHIVKLYQKLLLYQIKSVCLYHRNQVAVLVRDMFKLDDWDTQLKEIKDAEAAVQKDSEVYSTEQTKSFLRDLIGKATSQEQSLQSIHLAIQDQSQRSEQRQQDQRREQCLRVLYETDPSHDKKRIQDTKGGLFKDSYRWIIHHADFHRFRQDSQHRLMWIRGDPGKGKTMLLCGIIDELNKEPGAKVFFFFCQATESRLSNATAVLRGLVYSLLCQNPTLFRHVRKEYDRKGDKLLESNAWQVLLDMLTDMVEDPLLGGAFILIDALDECTTDLPQLLGFLTTASANVKWVVSSRNWPDITSKLNTTDNKLSMSLELNADLVSDAVRSYITHKVGILAKEKVYSDDIRSAVEMYLFDNANSTFLWVALVCHELAGPRVMKRHTLAKLKSFPPGLDSLYRRMMDQIIAAEDDSELCKQILATISIVYRPVTTRELLHLVEFPEDFDESDVEAVVESCGSFLTLREGTIYFVHQSAQDFLLQKASHQIYTSGVDQQHYLLFLKSLELLLHPMVLYRTMSTAYSTELAAPLYSAQYLCVYWVSHLVNSSVSTMSDADLDIPVGIIHRFLQEKYLYWLEALSLLGQIPEGIMSMEKLNGMITTLKMGNQVGELGRDKKGPRSDKNLSVLVNDARRFLLAHKVAIRADPLQVYASALVFSPTSSLIRDLYRSEAPALTMEPGMEESWSAFLQTLEGHSGWVHSVAFSIDNDILASGAEDSLIKIWDVPSGRCLKTFEGHTNEVVSVVFSADGRRLASGSYDNTIRIWDVILGECIQCIGTDQIEIVSVIFLHCGTRVASASVSASTIKIWNVVSGACLETLEGHTDELNDLAVSAETQQLASASYDQTVRVWDVASDRSHSRCLQTLRGHEGSVAALVFLQGDQKLASGSTDETIKIWNLPDGTCVQTLESHNLAVWSLDFSIQTQKLASSSGGIIHVWDSATGLCVQALRSRSDASLSVAISGDGKRLASGIRDHGIEIWDTEGSAELEDTQYTGDEVLLSVSSREGRWLAVGLADGTIGIWDIASGAHLRNLQSETLLDLSLHFLAVDQQLASNSEDGHIVIWDVSSGEIIKVLHAHGKRAELIAASSDDSLLASSSFPDNDIDVWDLPLGQYRKTFQGHDRNIEALAFSKDAQRLTSTDWDSIIKIWNVNSGECLLVIDTQEDRVTSTAFSNDGRLLVSYDYKQMLNIWDTATGACVRSIGIRGYLHAMSFLPGEGMLLSTDLGIIDLATYMTDDRQFEVDLETRVGYGISFDGTWIVKGGERILWLPPEHRPHRSAVVGSTVVISSRVNQVSFLFFGD